MSDGTAFSNRAESTRASQEISFCLTLEPGATEVIKKETAEFFVITDVVVSGEAPARVTLLRGDQPRLVVPANINPLRLKSGVTFARAVGPARIRIDGNARATVTLTGYIPF